MIKPRIFFGEMKLTRPISFRLPDPEYKRLLLQLDQERSVSDLLRKIIVKHNESIKNPENEQPSIK